MDQEAGREPDEGWNPENLANAGVFRPKEGSVSMNFPQRVSVNGYVISLNKIETSSSKPRSPFHILLFVLAHEIVGCGNLPRCHLMGQRRHVQDT